MYVLIFFNIFNFIYQFQNANYSERQTQKQQLIRKFQLENKFIQSMRKNKINCSTSKTKLKLKTQNKSKNKLRIKQSDYENEYCTDKKQNKSNKKILSPRRLFTQKNQLKAYKIDEEVIFNKNIQSKSKQRLYILCKNTEFIKDLQLFGIRNNEIICLIDNIKDSAYRKTNNLKEIIIASTLDQFTELYVDLVKELNLSQQRVKPSKTQQNIKIKVKWYMVCKAINSKNIQSNFNELYRSVNFVFVNDLIHLVNEVNLKTNSFNLIKQIQAETSNKQLMYNPKHKLSVDLLFKEIIHLHLPAQNQCLSNHTFSHQYLFVKEESFLELKQLANTLDHNKLYLCSKIQFEHFLKSIVNKDISAINILNKFIYLHDFQLFSIFRRVANLLQNMCQQQKFYLIYLSQTKETSNNKPQNSKTQMLETFLNFNQKQGQFLHDLAESSKILNSQQKNHKIHLNSFNSKETLKILINFKRKIHSQENYFFILLQSSFAQTMHQQKQKLSTNLFQNHKPIYLIIRDQDSVYSLIFDLRKHCSQNKQKLPSLFFICQKHINHVNSYLFQEIQVSQKIIIDWYLVLNQIKRKLILKQLFQKVDCKQISKKIALYGIKSQLYSSNNPFIQEICYFLNIKIQILSQNDSVYNNHSNQVQSNQKLLIKKKMQSTKNKINILFGKLLDSQKNQLFKKFLVIYLPTFQKLSMKKLMKTINEAYEKYFNLINHSNSLSSLQNSLNLFIFNIPSLASLLQIEKKFNNVIQNYSLNQFQISLKAIEKSKKQSNEIYYFIFQMQYFLQDYEKSIDNVRMKSDCQIQIYLRYGEQFIYRPKNGKYKFIKLIELKNQIHTLIENIKNFKDNQKLSERFDYSDNKILQINMMINNSGYDSPRKLQYFIDSPTKNQERSTLAIHNSFDNQLTISQENTKQKLQQNGQHFQKQDSKVAQQKQQQKIQKKLYIFINKALPLRCLQNRNKAQYSILAYNSPNQPLMLLPYLSATQFIVIIKKGLLLNRNKNYQFENSLSYGLENQSNKNLFLPLAQQFKNQFKVIELKEMSQSEVKNTIDNLIYQYKLKKNLSIKGNKLLKNQIPVIIYQNQRNKTEKHKRYSQKMKNLVNFVKQYPSISKRLPLEKKIQKYEKFHLSSPFSNNQISSLQQIKSQYLLEGSFYQKDNSPKKLQQKQNKLKQKKLELKLKKSSLQYSLSNNSEAYNELNDKGISDKSLSFSILNNLNQHQNIREKQKRQNYQQFILNLKKSNSYFSKYFYTCSEDSFYRIFSFNEDSKAGFMKVVQNLKLVFYYFGDSDRFNQFKSQIGEEIKQKTIQIKNFKGLIFKLFDPYIKPIDKNALKNKFKVHVSRQLILSKLVQEENFKRKIPQKLWNLSSKSKKSLSSKSIKLYKKEPSQIKSKLNISNTSSQTSIKYVDNQNNSGSSAINYYFSKQLIREKPLKNRINICRIIGSSALRKDMKKQNISFKSINITQFYSEINELLTILWENGDKQCFLIVLITKNELENLKLNLLLDKDKNVSLNDIMIIEVNMEAYKANDDDQSQEFLSSLLKYNSKIKTCVINRHIKQAENTIQQIQAKVQYQSQDIIQCQKLYERNNKIIKQIRKQMKSQSQNILMVSEFTTKIHVILCFNEDFLYLEPLVNSIVKKKNDNLDDWILKLQKYDSLQQAINLNLILLFPHCIIIPSEWSYLKINNGILIDYNEQHFQRKLSIFLNSMIKINLTKKTIKNNLIFQNEITQLK